MTKQRYPRILATLAALAAVAGACDATPLPYPPDIQTDRLVLLDDDLGGLTVTGNPGAAQPAGMILTLRNASRPAAPFTVTVAGDGSFTATLEGRLIDVVRFDYTTEDSGTLAHVATDGEAGGGVHRVPEPADADRDGWAAGLDCADDNPRAFPGAAEVCDGVDNDCNGVIDESPSCSGLPCSSDADCNDGVACDGEEVCTSGECASGSSPACGAGSWCDPSENTCVPDPAREPYCGNGVVEPPEGCDDGNHDDGDGCAADCSDCVAAAEICNGIDDDCDGVIDEDMSCGIPCITDADCDDGLFCTTETCSAGFCALGTLYDCPDDGDPATTEYCNEAIDGCGFAACSPVTETCNAIDDDCDGLVDEDPACGGCGVGLTMCGGSCVDLLADELNCGACGSACSAGQTCLRGICTA
jgi:hypothetical protein